MACLPNRPPKVYQDREGSQGENEKRLNGIRVDGDWGLHCSPRMVLQRISLAQAPSDHKNRLKRRKSREEASFSPRSDGISDRSHLGRSERQEGPASSGKGTQVDLVARTEEMQDEEVHGRIRPGRHRWGVRVLCLESP